MDVAHVDDAGFILRKILGNVVANRLAVIELIAHNANVPYIGIHRAVVQH